MLERRSPDLVLIGIAGLLTAIGIVMVFSASSAVAYTQYQDTTYYLKRELLWAGVGWAALFAAVRFDYAKLRPLAPLMFAIAVALLVVVLVPHIGTVSGGARRWLSLRFVSFEPSELAKLALVLFIARLLSARADGARSFRSVGFPVLFCVGVCFVLVMREPDLGTALMLLLTAFVMLFAAGARPVHLLLEACTVVPAVLVFIYGSPYRRERFLAFLHPWKDPTGTGYHIIQSLYALGSGGLFGLGLGQSRQKFGYLPAQHTDFIFSIIGEELGFIGAAAVLVTFLAFTYRGIRIAMQADDRFGFYLAVGITASITLQAFINVGVVTSSWPVTGVPLPFISYGGTSLATTLFAVGILASISRGRRQRVAALDISRRKAS
ncbi:MAG: putative lipid II flippase FtsW [Candidatus Eremiobacter antarcticus]|nr:putative lipid II flippase FtsW [Candidatus Eremiobacteraeota bacterium]MBC5808352.1 putative lipid II flippase FtsW [Candidatus Eremiobacteraeota bacterium]PZR63720.1 MAG: putative lipid II flippase FtsW [Candidatus Eremiobacter sp. RRmetagenome_bin22]